MGTMKEALEVLAEVEATQHSSMCSPSYLHRMRKGSPRCNGTPMVQQRKDWCL
jgi:hypothetical protein